MFDVTKACSSAPNIVAQSPHDSNISCRVFLLKDEVLDCGRGRRSYFCPLTSQRCSAAVHYPGLVFIKSTLPYRVRLLLSGSHRPLMPDVYNNNNKIYIIIIRRRRIVITIIISGFFFYIALYVTQVGWAHLALQASPTHLYIYIYSKI